MNRGSCECGRRFMTLGSELQLDTRSKGSLRQAEHRDPHHCIFFHKQLRNWKRRRTWHILWMSGKKWPVNKGLTRSVPKKMESWPVTIWETEDNGRELGSLWAMRAWNWVCSPMREGVGGRSYVAIGTCIQTFWNNEIIKRIKEQGHSLGGKHSPFCSFWIASLTPSVFSMSLTPVYQCSCQLLCRSTFPACHLICSPVCLPLLPYITKHTDNCLFNLLAPLPTCRSQPLPACLSITLLDTLACCLPICLQRWQPPANDC